VRIEMVSATHPEAAALLAGYLDELRARLGGFDPSRSVSADPEEMQLPRGAFLLMYLDEQPVACGGVKTLGPGVAEIKRMFVAPEARGRGLGRRLLVALEEAARSLGLSRVMLDTAAPLAEAQRLYEASGYHEVPAYNDNPYAARWYEKRL
jgi:GNAT superfamily N-acetyltransferase